MLNLYLVMAIRCMGQFIGREKVYSSINIFQNCREIYHQQGIGGFFVYVKFLYYEFYRDCFVFLLKILVV